MDNTLQQRRVKAEEQFDVLVKQKEQKEQEIREIDAELNRLQGEYRVINDLLTTVSPSAEVLDVDAAIEKKGKKNG